MIIESKYESTPIYGVISNDKKRFNDCDLFKADLWKYAVLKKIKIWWGSPRKTENMNKIKTLLGIQCKYKNIMTGEEIESEAHCGHLDSNDIEKKEIELKQNDYFNHFYLAFDTPISYIKFETKRKEIIEFGRPTKEDLKKIKINMGNEPYMIQCFVGYYNENRVTALGCKFIKKNDYIIINIMDFFKINNKEQEKWKDKNFLNQHNLFIRTLAKLCLLPDAQFSTVINN